MKKSIATLIDELSVTNIKIYHLVDKIENNKHTPDDSEKLRDLNKYHSELCQALNRSKTMNPVRDKKSQIFAESSKKSRISNGMKKSIAALIDELSVTNIKIYHLVDKIEKNKHTSKDTEKLQDLNNLHSELCRALNRSTTMKKALSALVDELTVTNIKIYHLVDKITKDEHTRADAKRAQDLNRYRSEICNALNREFKQREDIKV